MSTKHLATKHLQVDDTFYAIAFSGDEQDVFLLDHIVRCRDEVRLAAWSAWSAGFA